MTFNEAVALIEFTRNLFADQCQDISERDFDNSAADCKETILSTDCHTIFTAWMASK